jgi:hypothetical protein
MIAPNVLKSQDRDSSKQENGQELPPTPCVWLTPTLFEPGISVLESLDVLHELTPKLGKGRLWWIDLGEQGMKVAEQGKVDDIPFGSTNQVSDAACVKPRLISFRSRQYKADRPFFTPCPLPGTSSDNIVPAVDYDAPVPTLSIRQSTSPFDEVVGFDHEGAARALRPFSELLAEHLQGCASFLGTHDPSASAGTP